MRRTAKEKVDQWLREQEEQVKVRAQELVDAQKAYDIKFPVLEELRPLAERLLNSRTSLSTHRREVYEGAELEPLTVAMAESSVAACFDELSAEADRRGGAFRVPIGPCGWYIAVSPE